MGPGPERTVASRTAAEEAEEARLLAAREAFPGWEIIEAFDRYLAVPAGSAVVQSISLDGLVRKLREQDGKGSVST